GSLSCALRLLCSRGISRLWGLFVSHVLRLGGIDAALMREGQRAGEVALAGTQPGGVLQLAGRVLEAQPEQVLANRLDLLQELVVLEVAHLLGLHHWSSRRTNFVRTGSLCPARR